MTTSDHTKPRGPWVLSGWLLVILCGALTTSLLRAPLVLSGVLPIVLVSHVLGGALMAAIAIGQLTVARPSRCWWRVTLIAGTAVCGWLAHQSFAPLTIASHATLAAFAILALTGVDVGALASIDSRPRPRISVLAQVGFVLTVVQVGAGAALRHHLIGLAWHILIGGLAAMTVLGAAAATLQHQTTSSAEKQAAKSAVAAIVAQASLGVAVLFMILIGPPNAGTWIGVTVGHVVVGSLTLLAVARLHGALRCHGFATQRPGAPHA